MSNDTQKNIEETFIMFTKKSKSFLFLGFVVIFFSLSFISCGPNFGSLTFDKIFLVVEYPADEELTLKSKFPDWSDSDCHKEFELEREAYQSEIEELQGRLNLDSNKEYKYFSFWGWSSQFIETRYNVKIDFLLNSADPASDSNNESSLIIPFVEEGDWYSIQFSIAGPNGQLIPAIFNYHFSRYI